MAYILEVFKNNQNMEGSTLIIAIDDYVRLGTGDIKEIADIKFVDYFSDNSDNLCLMHRKYKVLSICELYLVKNKQKKRLLIYFTCKKFNNVKIHEKEIMEISFFCGR